MPAGIKISLQSPQLIMGLSANYISPDVSVAFEPKKEKIEAYLIKRLFLLKIIFPLGKSRKSSPQPLKVMLCKSV